jgi:adenylate cyclase
MNLDTLPAHAARFLLSPEAIYLGIEALMERTASALREGDGVQVDRMSWTVPTLHPEVYNAQNVWQADRPFEAHQRTYRNRSTEMYKASPFRLLMEGEATEIRCPIFPDDPAPAFPIMRQFAEAGFTDYLAMIQPPRNRYEQAPVTFATRRPGGFSEADVASLRALLPLLTLLLTLAGQRARSRDLLETYVGVDAATRVLDGNIRRGEMIDVEAAVCFCDLRDFTRLSQDLSQEDLLQLLHEAFEVVVGAMQEFEGDVLKFIGDAVLAVFRREPNEPDLEAAACRAVQAALLVIERAEQAHLRRLEAGRSPLKLGLAVHVGHVAYGNIGAPTRLDFTVIGATVNVASRLEGFCKTLGAPLVLSEAVASLVLADPAFLASRDLRLQDFGPHTLRGVDTPMHVFGAFPKGDP